MAKKVLIITYYWPPSGGSGVQRWLKFAKYLGGFGWDPVIYTPENPEIPVSDESLFKDIPANVKVIKQPIWEPYNFYKKFIGQKKEEKISVGFLSERKKPKLTEKLSVWIRGNFFIPDARVFWVKPSVKFLSGYLQKNKVDAIISTGPPHSMHLIALGLKEKFDIPWVADFRDPWTNIDFYRDLMLTKWADKKHHKLEKKVLSNADVILTVGNTMKEEFEEMHAKNVHVITNGYDEDDIYKGSVEHDKKFSLAHIGSLVKTRNPVILWDALAELVKENAEFAGDLEIKLVGKVDFSAINNIKEKRLDQFLNKIEYLPHNEVMMEQQKSRVLLLLLNDTPNSKGLLTGKLFEYLASKRPVLCIGPEDGDAAEILKKTGVGETFGFENKKGLKESLKTLYQKYKMNQLGREETNAVKYSRKNLTKELVRHLDKCTRSK